MMAADANPSPPDWHCYACNTRVEDCSIGYSDPSGEPQCSSCGRFGFLEPLDHTEVVSEERPARRNGRSTTTLNGVSPFFSAEISAVAVPIHAEAFSAIRNPVGEDGFRVTFDGLDMSLQRERSARTAEAAVSSGGGRPETQIFAFDLTRPESVGDDRSGATTSLQLQLPSTFLNDLLGDGGQFEAALINRLFNDDFDPTLGAEPRATWLPAIADLPRKVLAEVNIEGPCTICQEDFKKGDIVTSLVPDPSQCAHIFHSSCIIPWLSEHNSCPVCRFELPADLEEYERRKGELHTSRRGQSLMRQPEQEFRFQEESTSSSSRLRSAPSPLSNATPLELSERTTTFSSPVSPVTASSSSLAEDPRR